MSLIVAWQAGGVTPDDLQANLNAPDLTIAGVHPILVKVAGCTTRVTRVEVDIDGVVTLVGEATS